MSKRERLGEVPGSDFAWEYVDTLRGWDEWVQRDSQGKDSIIDSDISPRRNPAIFRNLKEVRKRLEDLSDGLGPDEQDRDVLEQNFAAHFMRLRELEGEKISHKDCVRTLMGVELVPVPEDKIELTAETLDEIISGAGLRFDKAHKVAFEEKFLVRDIKKLKEPILTASRIAHAVMGERIHLPSGVIIPQIVNKDAPWSGYTSTDAGGEVFTEINTHENWPQSFGRVTMITNHENNHAIDLGLKQQAVLTGTISPAVGVMPNHSSICTQAEAIAHIGEKLINANRTRFGGDSSLIYSFESLHAEYKEMVSHNASIKINDGVDLDEVIEYAAELEPFEPIANIRNFTIACRDHPVIRAYYSCFVPALNLVRPVLDMKQEDQKVVLSRLYNKALTPGQIEELVASKAKV